MYVLFADEAEAGVETPLAELDDALWLLAGRPAPGPKMDCVARPDAVDECAMAADTAGEGAV